MSDPAGGHPIRHVLARTKPKYSRALMRVAKSRLRPFFADPRAMIELRRWAERAEEERERGR